MSDKKEAIVFWNGNKSSARKDYELELLAACLTATQEQYGQSVIQIDNTDYTTAEGEGGVFATGADILVTVAGNTKFKDKEKIVIAKPLTKGLLGYRLLVIKDESLEQFNAVMNAEDLQRLSIGIPETWADAELFRQNAYSVKEQGTYSELFSLLKKDAFDYTALGVNEIEEAFELRAAPLGGMRIEPSIMLYYPFPLVFYVNKKQPTLAKRITEGLLAIQKNGKYDALFEKHHKDIVSRLNLKQRKIFTLKNPILPDEMADFKATLLD